jgi:hypothetical protein
MSNIPLRPQSPLPRPAPMPLPMPAAGPAGRAPQPPAPAPARSAPAPPGLPHAMQSKFKSNKANRAREYFDTTSFYRAGLLPSEPDAARAGEVKLGSKSRMMAALRHGRLGTLGVPPRIGATLDALLASPQDSATFARRAGLPGCPNGGGVLGAIAMRARPRAAAPAPAAVAPAAVAQPRPPAQRTPGILGHKAAGGAPAPPMLTPAPARPAPSALERGLQRLSALLAERSGPAAALLSGTELGQTFQAIETMQEALQPRAAQVLLNQRLMPSWG